MRGGKVDFSNLLRDMRNAERKIRWRTLVCRANGAQVEMYGYGCKPEGPWFGHPRAEMINVPCTHCGQTGVFNGDWRHVCPGGCNLIEDHLCRGEPSMYHAPMWRCADWYEAR